MKLRSRLEALETRSGSSPADLIICSTPEEATRRNLPPEAVVIVTGVSRSPKEADK